MPVVNTLSPETRLAITNYLNDLAKKMDAWVAEDPSSRFGGVAEPQYVIDMLERYVPDVHSFEDYLAYTAWEDYCELHKDKHGIRPRWTSWHERTEQGWIAEMKAM